VKKCGEVRPTVLPDLGWCTGNSPSVEPPSVKLPVRQPGQASALYPAGRRGVSL